MTGVDRDDQPDDAFLDSIDEARTGPPPELPDWFGTSLPSPVRSELHSVLAADTRKLGSTYAARIAHPTLGPTHLLPFTDAANAGAVSNLNAIINAVSDGKVPNRPEAARQVRSGVRSLLKRVRVEQTKTHLSQVLAQLDEVISDPDAANAESEELAAASTALEQDAADVLHSASGVYVYTFPHYWRHPYVESTERRLLKVGRTASKAWDRVIAQARATGMPEDPLLLRVYTSDDPVKSESVFHRLLVAAEHERVTGRAAGKEWFVTTIDFLDEIARALALDIKSAALPDGL